MKNDDTVEHSGDEAPKKNQSGSQEDHPLLAESVIKRLMTLDEFAKANPGKAVSETVLELFPELWEIEQARLQPISLPTTAPARWTDDRKLVDGSRENPPQFIARVYSPWLGKGLTRADVRRLDSQLSAALDNWLRRNEMPPELDLPTVKERNSRWIEAAETGGLSSIPAIQGSHSLKALASLEAARRRRRGHDEH